MERGSDLAAVIAQLPARAEQWRLPGDRAERKFGRSAAAAMVGGVVAGFGIANEKKWGYALGIAMAIFPFGLRFFYSGNPLSSDLLSLMFEIALVALLLHPQSRDYQRLWFK